MSVAFSDVQDLYSDAQVLTSTGNTDSTNVIDQLAAGDTYVPNFVRISVNAAFTSGGAATLGVSLLTDDDPAFGTATTFPLVSTAALSALTTGAVLYQGRLPLGMKRYRKLVYAVGVAAMTAGKVDAVEVMDIATNRM